MDISTIDELCRDTRLFIDDSEYDTVVRRLRSLCDSCDVLSDINTVETCQVDGISFEELRADSPFCDSSVAKNIVKGFPEESDGLIVAPHSFKEE